MRISIESTVLADPDISVGKLGPSGLTVNGQQIVDEAQFFRAAAPVFYARGTLGVVLQFTVHRIFATLAAAEAFALMHFNATPLEGLVTCVCGETGATQTVYLNDAVVEAVQLPSSRGLVVAVQYTIKGGAFTSDVPPEDIPGDPDNGEEFVVLRRGKVAIGAGVSSVVVTFSAPLAVVTSVQCTISRPAGSPAIDAFVREDSITVNGFTVDLSAETPDTTYRLHYLAIE